MMGLSAVKLIGEKTDNQARSAGQPARLGQEMQPDAFQLKCPSRYELSEVSIGSQSSCLRHAG